MPKHNAKHDTPSNQRYTSEGRLEKNKVRRIAKNQRVSEKDARKMWRDAKEK